jgi:hypothetical protein
MTVFWDIVPWSQVQVYRRSEVLAMIALMMEAASTSKTLVNFCQTTSRNISEDTRLHIRRRENLKSQLHLVCLY